MISYITTGQPDLVSIFKKNNTVFNQGKNLYPDTEYQEDIWASDMLLNSKIELDR